MIFELNRSSWFSYGPRIRKDAYLPSIGCVQHLKYVPIFSLYDIYHFDNKFIFRINFDPDNRISLGRSYNDIFDALEGSKIWANSDLKDCENLLFHRGAIMDIEDRLNPKLLLCLCFKPYKYSEYVDESGNFFSMKEINYDDLVLFVSNNFITGEKAVYSKLYKKLFKDFLITQVYNNSIEVRHVSEIYAFENPEFPQFETIDIRKDFCSNLNKFFNSPIKIKFCWQTETDKQDTSLNETQLSLWEKTSDLNHLLKKMKVPQKSVPPECLVDS